MVHNTNEQATWLCSDRSPSKQASSQASKNIATNLSTAMRRIVSTNVWLEKHDHDIRDGTNAVPNWRGMLMWIGTALIFQN